MKNKHNDVDKDEVKKNDNDTKILINCEHCPQKLSTFEKLMQHLEDTKANENRNKCDKIFSSKGNLTVHLKTVHEGSKFICDKYDKSYQFKTKLNRHI